MRILYIGKFKHEHSTENYVTWALENLGHKILQIPSHYVEKDNLVKNKIVSFKPDFVLFSKAADSKRIPDLLKWLKSKGILSVCWLWDLFLIPERPNFPDVINCDLVFSTDGDLSKFSELKNYFVLRQGIHFPESYSLKPNYKFDVGFVGHSGRGFQFGRSQLIRFLRNRYQKKFIHHQTTRGKALNKALSQVKVIVGDSYPSINYWSNRVYEITGRGGFLLMPEMDGDEFSTEFIDGEHYSSYPRGDYRELKRRIDYFLTHTTERELIKRQGHKITSTNYTYTERCRVLLEQLKKHGDSYEAKE